MQMTTTQCDYPKQHVYSLCTLFKLLICEYQIQPIDKKLTKSYGHLFQFHIILIHVHKAHFAALIPVSSFNRSSIIEANILIVLPSFTTLEPVAFFAIFFSVAQEHSAPLFPKSFYLTFASKRQLGIETENGPA